VSDRDETVVTRTVRLQVPSDGGDDVVAMLRRIALRPPPLETAQEHQATSPRGQRSGTPGAASIVWHAIPPRQLLLAPSGRGGRSHSRAHHLRSIQVPARVDRRSKPRQWWARTSPFGPGHESPSVVDRTFVSESRTSRPERMLLRRESSTPIPHRGSHPTSGVAHPAGAPSASRFAQLPVGDVPAAPGSPPGGNGPRGRVRRQVPRPVLAEGVASGPPHVGHRAESSRNASFRAVLGYHRTPPCPVGIRHAFSCAAICDQERGLSSEAR
jgi:hypothetical protein